MVILDVIIKSTGYFYNVLGGCFMYFLNENEKIMKKLIDILTEKELERAVSHNVLVKENSKYTYHDKSLYNLRMLKERAVLLFPSIFRLVISQNTPELDDVSIDDLNDGDISIYDTIPPNKTENFEDEKFSITVLDIADGSIYVNELVEGLSIHNALKGIHNLERVFKVSSLTE